MHKWVTTINGTNQNTASECDCFTLLLCKIISMPCVMTPSGFPLTFYYSNVTQENILCNSSFEITGPCSNPTEYVLPDGLAFEFGKD